MEYVHVYKETTLTVEKKPLVIGVLYLGSISLQTRTKLKKSLKNTRNCCKLQTVFKKKTRLGNNFHMKDQISKDLNSDVVYKFQCGLCLESYYNECVRHVNIRIGEYIGLSPLTKKQVKRLNSSVADHLLRSLSLVFCNHSASYDDYSILTRENKNYYMRYKPSLNRNITSAEADLGLVKLIVMTNVFFNYHQHEIEMKRLICVK